MSRRLSRIVSLSLLCFVTGVSSVAAADVPSALSVGAARIDVTPAVADLPAPLVRVHDPIHIRALVVDSAGKRVVFVVTEVPMVEPGIQAELKQKISEEFDVAPDLIVLGNTHTHNSMRVARSGNSPIPTSEKFTQAVISGAVDAVRQAVSRSVPAKAGFAAGHSDLVSGRNEWYPAQHRYIDGIDRTGTDAVDRTFGVYAFKTLDDKPIAVLLNYGIEPVVYEQVNTDVSGDVPGAVSNYVESALGNDAVALFTIGAPATPTYRVWYGEDPTKAPAKAAAILQAMGVILGEEALWRLNRIDASARPLEIAAASDSLTCPGKITTPRNLRNLCAYTDDAKLPACKFSDGPFPDVTLSMTALRLGDVTYIAADGNVIPTLWQKFQQQSPVKQTQIIGTNFGPFRFVVDDAAYALNTYPATDTRAAANCAEPAFLKSALDLLARTR